MTRKFHLAALIAATMIFGALVFGAGSATAAEIKILASANAALRGALTELAPQLERATGHRVAMDFASAMPLKRRIDAGEAFDLVIAPALVEDLVKQGKVAADTRTAFARTGLGIGVAKGTPKPDVSSVDAFKRTLLNAKSIGNNPESEPGNQFLAVLDSLAIAQDVRPRLKSILTGAEMGAALQKRDVDLVVSSITNLLETPTIDATGFPPGIQRYLDMVAGVSATTKEPQAAKAVLQFLLSPTATAVLKAKGFERE
jgi:molybdate transport system substrate-binding protein